MPRPSAIAPFPETPEGIQAFQEQESYPVYHKLLEERHRAGWDYQEAINNATYLVQRGTLISWKTIRKLAWIRDEGICGLCGEPVGSSSWDLGHIVDRVCGGTDRLDNVTVMHWFCNRGRKRLCETKEEFLVWRESREWEAHEQELFAQYLAKNLSDNR